MQVVAVTAVLLAAGCVSPWTATEQHDPSHSASWTTDHDGKVNASPLTDEALDEVPTFRRLLDETVENGTASATFDRGTEEAIRRVLDGRPRYNPQAAPKPHPDVVYLRVNGSVVLVHPANGTRNVAVRAADGTYRNVTNVSHDELDAVPALRDLIATAAPTHRVVETRLNRSSFDDVVAFLAERTRYRPGGSRRPPRGTYVRYRNETIGIRMWHNDTAATPSTP